MWQRYVLNFISKNLNESTKNLGNKLMTLNLAEGCVSFQQEIGTHEKGWDGIEQPSSYTADRYILFHLWKNLNFFPLISNISKESVLF